MFGVLVSAHHNEAKYDKHSPPLLDIMVLLDKQSEETNTIKDHCSNIVTPFML